MENKGRFCSNCGYQLAEGMKCCPKCGTPIDHVDTGADTEKADIAESGQEKPIEAAQPSASDAQPRVAQLPKRKSIFRTWKFVVPCAVFLFLIVCGIAGHFSGNQYENSVEDGLGTMGARFNFTQDEFIQKYNTIVKNQVYQMPDKSNWEQKQYTDEKTGAKFLSYTCSLNKTYFISTSVEAESNKVANIEIGTPYRLYNENPKDFEAIVEMELVSSLGVDEKSAIILYRNSAAAVAEGKVPCYNNIVLTLEVPTDGSSVFFIISPASEKVKQTISNLEVITD